MAITIVDISPKLQNGDSDTVASTDMLVSVGMGRSSNPGRVFATPFHQVGSTTYTQQFFEENSPGSTNTYSYGSFTRSPPSGSQTEDQTWSGAMVSSGDGDSVRYGLDGTHASNNLGGDAIAFTSTSSPAAITLTPVPNDGDAIFYWIAFNAGGINADPSGFGSPDVTGEMGNLSQGRWYSKISDGTETTVAATLTGNRTGTHCAVVVPAAADDGVSVTATLDTLSITDFNTTVTALVSVDINATSDSLTITDFNTAVTALVDLNVNTTLDTLTIANFNAVVTALVDSNISATADALTITDFNTVVTALVDSNISASLDTLTITDFNATVQVGQDTSITATLDTLTITNFDATVTALVDVSITASLDTLSITDFNAIIQTGSDTNINATVDNLSITDFDTTVTALVDTVINTTSDSLAIANFNAVIVSGGQIVIAATADFSIAFTANVDAIIETANINTTFTANINTIDSAELNEVS